MRIPALAILAIGTVSLAAPAAAQPRNGYPVCMRVYGAPTYDECSFTSLAQCSQSASGRPASCSNNPYYAAYATGEPHGPGQRWHRRVY